MGRQVYGALYAGVDNIGANCVVCGDQMQTAEQQRSDVQEIHGATSPIDEDLYCRLKTNDATSTLTTDVAHTRMQHGKQTIVSGGGRLRCPTRRNRTA